MADPLTSSASQFDVLDPEEANNEILRPVTLSPTSRRQVDVMDRRQSGVDNFSMAAQLDDERAQRLEDIDKQEDEAWNREMVKKTNAINWNNKVLAQQHGANLLSALETIKPQDDDYLEQLKEVTKAYPLGADDPRVASVLAANQAIYQKLQKVKDEERIRANAAEDRRTIRIESDAIRDENRRVAQDSNYDTKASSLSPEAYAEYKKQLSTDAPKSDAFNAALAVHTKNVTATDYKLAQADKRLALKEIEELNKKLNTTDYPQPTEQQKENFITEISRLQIDVQASDEVMEAYRAKKNIPTKKPGGTQPPPAPGTTPPATDTGTGTTPAPATDTNAPATDSGTPAPAPTNSANAQTTADKKPKAAMTDSTPIVKTREQYQALKGDVEYFDLSDRKMKRTPANKKVGEGEYHSPGA